MKELRQWSASEAAAGKKAANTWQKYFEARGLDEIQRAEEIEAAGRIAEVYTKYEDTLLTFENVVGVATTLKVTEGKPTTTWCLTVLVEKKLPLNRVPKESRVPGQIDGVPTDVLEVGRPEALVFNARVRPALPGYSIGHHNITAGTFGCLVRDIRRCCCPPKERCHPPGEECPGDYLILSNNHVLADVNAAKAGDLILQPGPFDGGLFPSDAVATLDRFEPIVFGRSGYNLVDAAVARPTHTRNVTGSLLGLLIPRGVDQAFVGSAVIKVGRTTQVTTGRVLAVNATVAVGFGPAGVAVFRHQIITTAMAAGGDSGSLLMNPSLAAIGLLYAGSAIITIHNHLADVETALGVRPVTAPTVA
jgi:hypothetical protein